MSEVQAVLLGNFIQDINAKKPYGFNWVTWLAGASLSLSTWVVSPLGPTLSSETNSAGVTGLRISGVGATLLVKYTITNHVETDDVRDQDRSFAVEFINK